MARFEIQVKERRAVGGVPSSVLEGELTSALNCQDDIVTMPSWAGRALNCDDFEGPLIDGDRAAEMDPAADAPLSPLDD